MAYQTDGKEPATENVRSTTANELMAEIDAFVRTTRAARLKATAETERLMELAGNLSQKEDFGRDVHADYASQFYLDVLLQCIEAAGDGRVNLRAIVIDKRLSNAKREAFLIAAERARVALCKGGIGVAVRVEPPVATWSSSFLHTIISFELDPGLAMLKEIQSSIT